MFCDRRIERLLSLDQWLAPHRAALTNRYGNGFWRRCCSLFGSVERIDELWRDTERGDGSLLKFAESYKRFGAFLCQQTLLQTIHFVSACRFFSQQVSCTGFHRVDGGIMLREWAPNATAMSVIGDFNQWGSEERDFWRLFFFQ